MFPALAESTGLGAARMAPLGAGLMQDANALPPLQPPARRYTTARELGGAGTRFADAVERARRRREAGTPRR